MPILSLYLKILITIFMVIIGQSCSLYSVPLISKGNTTKEFPIEWKHTLEKNKKNIKITTRKKRKVRQQEFLLQSTITKGKKSIPSLSKGQKDLEDAMNPDKLTSTLKKKLKKNFIPKKLARLFKYERPKNFSWIRFFLGDQIVLEGVVGGGTVSTSTIENGKAIEVASGRSFQTGFRLASEPSTRFKKADKFGWSTGFSPFAFLKSLSLSDIKQNLPSSPKENTTTIPAVVTNEQGITVDPNDPNQANFKLNSYGVDYLISGSFKLSRLSFLNVFMGIAVMESRTSTAKYGASVEETVQAWQFFKSARFGGQWQNNLPHISQYFDMILRIGLDAQVYWNIPLSDKIEFRYPYVSYNQERQVFERRRVTVKDYEMTQFTARMSLIFAY
jgi:hypothetical protein